jgi:hypothetical protein
MTELDQLGDVKVQSLLDLDPDLAEHVPAHEREQARRAALLPTITLAEGRTDVLRRLGAKPDISGFVIIDGLILREVGLDTRTLPELLGPGDVLSPPAESTSFLPLTDRITPLAPTRLAVLGPTFARACGQWPSMLATIERRRGAQRERVAVHGAILQLARVEHRLLALMWHLAATWGRVGSDGIVVPFSLTHEMVGLFVGAERSTVTLAAGELSDMGLLDRQSDRTWLLRDGSDEWLRRELGVATEVPSALGRARRVRRESRGLRDESRATRAEAQQARRRRDALHE